MIKAEKKQQVKLGISMTVFIILLILALILAIPQTNKWFKRTFPNTYANIQKVVNIAVLVAAIVVTLFLATIFPPLAILFYGIATGMAIGGYFYVKNSFAGIQVTDPVINSDPSNGYGAGITYEPNAPRPRNQPDSIVDATYSGEVSRGTRPRQRGIVIN